MVKSNPRKKINTLPHIGIVFAFAYLVINAAKISAFGHFPAVGYDFDGDAPWK